MDDFELWEGEVGVGEHDHGWSEYCDASCEWDGGSDEGCPVPVPVDSQHARELEEA